jgi:hypothetical protein
VILTALIVLIAVNAFGVFVLLSIASDIRIVRELTRVQAQKIDIFLEAINNHILDIRTEIKKK